MAKPYIGITGATNECEVIVIGREFRKNGYERESDRMPLQSFLVCPGSMHSSKYENNRYPKYKDLRNILMANRLSNSMIHYNCSDASRLIEKLLLLFNDQNIFKDNLCRMLQLNVAWPSLESVSGLKSMFPGLEIVLQLSEEARHDLSHSEIAKKLSRYGSSIDYALIDHSSGKGKELDISSAFESYARIKDACPDLAIGFAGGFNAQNIFQKASELVKSIGNSDFSLDVESGVRLSNKTSSNDRLSIDKVRTYLQNISKVLK